MLLHTFMEYQLQIAAKDIREEDHAFHGNSSFLKETKTAYHYKCWNAECRIRNAFGLGTSVDFSNQHRFAY